MKVIVTGEFEFIDKRAIIVKLRGTL